MSRLEERIENFNKAFNVFKEAHDEYLKDPSRIVFRLAEIQGFEVLFELSWKVLKDYIEIKGYKDRNFSSHEYNMKKFDEIIEKICTKYYDAICKFYTWVKEES